MKVKLIPTVSYEVETEDGLKLGTFIEKSEWNGMVQLDSGVQRMIIEAPRSILDFSLLHAQYKLARVISCTSGLSLAIQREPAVCCKTEVDYGIDAR